MKRIRLLFAIQLFVAFGVACADPEKILQSSGTPQPEDENSHDLFYYETAYTLDTDYTESKLGHTDSLYNDFSYDHRFLINGNWYFRGGVEYERFDFEGTNNGLPDHLQAASAHVALEYVVKDQAGGGVTSIRVFISKTRSVAMLSICRGRFLEQSR